MGNSIEVAGVGKRYTVGGRQGAKLLTEVIANRMRGRGGGKGEDFWALQQVSFTVGTGELIGIIGRNGAGKTTLLRILARITAPTAGVARVRGRLSALLDVGTGFHDELTGRENVFLSGAILGMSRRDVRARFDEIAAFSGVERFLDTPLKRYSAGMRLRLAFAVAAHLEPDVLVIDEALAVGDAEFQRRCIGRMEDLQRSGRTVVFVSHELGAIGRLCERTLWLDQGRIAFDGPTPETLRRYFDAVGRIDAGRVELETDPHLPVALTSVWITAEDGPPITERDATRHRRPPAAGAGARADPRSRCRLLHRGLHGPARARGHPSRRRPGVRRSAARRAKPRSRSRSRACCGPTTTSSASMSTRATTTTWSRSRCVSASLQLWGNPRTDCVRRCGRS